MRAAAVAIGLAFAAPAMGQHFLPGDTARLDMTLGKVRSGRAYFYSGTEKPGCPAPAESCRRRAYVTAGDVVLLGETRGALVAATFADGRATTEGWLPRSAVTALRAPPPTLASWRGAWSRDEADIEIGPGARSGTLRLEGHAVWGSHDPDRVARGGVHVGEFDETAAPIGDRLGVGDGPPGQCHVLLRLIGPYLVIADNNLCGGMNVSFSGVYRRAGAH